MKLFSIYILILLLGCSACKEGLLSPKEELPPATQEGKNTFGCLVNGEVWLPKGGITINKLTYDYNPTYNKNYFQVRAKRYFVDNGKDVSQTLSITIEEEFVETIAYKLEDPSSSRGRYANLEIPCVLETAPGQPGILAITKLDTVNHIIAGTFEFTVWTEDCDTIKVTDGRFDIKYQQ